MDQLLAELLDGQISDDGFARLQARLASSPEMRDYYVEYLSLCSDLNEIAALAVGVDDWPIDSPVPRPVLPVTRSGHAGEPGEGSPGIDPGGAGAIIGSSAPSDRRLAKIPDLRRHWLPWALAAAACCVAMLSAAFAVRRGPAGGPTTPQIAKSAGQDRQGPAQSDRRAVTVGDAIAVVVKLDEVSWEAEDRPPPTVGMVLAPGRFRLKSGRATLAFFNGVTLTLEGPSDVDLVSLGRVFCHRGKLRTHVPDGAEGFVVAEEGSEVVDLGTELGLNIDADGKARLMVFEGEADAAVLEASGSAQRNRTIKEHQALTIDPGRMLLEDAEARPESFVSPPVLAIPPLELAPSYRDAVLAARPWGYWRFESMDDGAVANEVGGRPSLRATGPVRLAGVGNRSVAFGSGEAEQFLLMDGLWTPPPGDPGYAVELWFSPERIGLAALAGMYVPRGGDVYEHTFLLELTAQNRESPVFKRVSIRFLHRWPPGFWGGDNLFSDYYLPYRWHHVVAQVKGDQMELYVDGAPLPKLQVSPHDATEARQFLVGMLKPLPRPPGIQEIRNFVGQIDEIALYDHPLVPAEIRRHFELGVPGGAQSGQRDKRGAGRSAGAVPNQ
jgi:hypothetical protein